MRPINSIKGGTMTESRKPVDVATAFTEAWTSHDLDCASKYVGEDVVFNGPMGHAEGVKGYVESWPVLAKKSRTFDLSLPSETMSRRC